MTVTAQWSISMLVTDMLYVLNLKVSSIEFDFLAKSWNWNKKSLICTTLHEIAQVLHAIANVRIFNIWGHFPFYAGSQNFEIEMLLNYKRPCIFIVHKTQANADKDEQRECIVYICSWCANFCRRMIHHQYEKWKNGKKYKNTIYNIFCRFIIKIFNCVHLKIKYLIINNVEKFPWTEGYSKKMYVP